MRFHTFLREESGALAPVFAFSLVPMIALAGAAIDISNLTRAKSTLQVAVDSTALALNHNLHLASQAGLEQKADAYFGPQTTSLENPDVTKVEFNVGGGWVRVEASAMYTPSVMNMFGFGPITFKAKSKTVVGDQEIEIAMVLDNSGSMDDEAGKMKALEDAADSLVATVFSSANASTRIKVGVVPFAGSVNVGPDKATADWIDKDAKSPIHSENFVVPANRFTLFSEMKETSWAGCVEVRGGTYGMDDTEADPDIGATLFVPMFAPDEPNGFLNSYLNDDGDCTSQEKTITTNEAKQARVCKYKGKKPTANTVWHNEMVTGPNFWCSSSPIQELTNDTVKLYAALDKMKPKGATNIHEGLMWGWRVLSPGKPFQEGKAYNTPNLRKYIVLMTDGENTASGRDNYNKSDYSAYGYSVKGRYGVTSSSTSTLQDKMDDNLKAACAKAKLAGIAIYTIGFKLPKSATATKSMLSECASMPSMAYLPSKNSDLQPVFQSIAKELGKLRIVE